MVCNLPKGLRKGLTVFLTGYSGAGKSTIARELYARLLRNGEDRPITLLDGDLLRKEISSDLGFSKDDREEQIRRVGVIASKITSEGGVAICALIAPYERSRWEARELINKYGGYVEVYVATPLDVCESRDPKGLYQKARIGIIADFTGISAPYEVPSSPEISVDASCLSLEDIVDRIMDYLAEHGYVRIRCNGGGTAS